MSVGPLSIPNLVGWWDFSDANTLFQDSGRTTPVVSNGDSIQGVTDKSGFGNHLVDNGSGGPIYSTGVQNGLSVADNIGASGYLQNASLNVGSPHGFIVVARTPASIDGSAGNSIVSSTTFPGATTNIQLVTAATRYFSSESTFVTSVLDAGAPPTSTWRIYVFDMDGVSNPVYIENTFDVNNTAGALTRTNGLRLMHDDNLGNGEWDSYLAEMYLFDGALAASTRTSLVTQLKAKWAI